MIKNEYYELIEYFKDKEGMFCLVGGICFGVIVLSSSHITGCRLDR